MKKQELIHVNGFVEELADDASRTYSEVVERYLEEQGADLSHEPYASAEDEKLFRQYMHENIPVMYTEVHKQKRDHQDSVREKMDELIAFYDYAAKYEASAAPREIEYVSPAPSDD